MEVLKVNPQIERNQVDRLRRLRQKRDGASVQETLRELRVAAQGPGNLMPKIIAAVESFATVGELAEVLRSVFGEHRETIVL